MLLNVRVIPRSSKNMLEWEQETLKARLMAPPVDGAANAALINLLAERLSVPRRTISIVRGETNRQKVVDIADLTLEEIRRRL
ncbi:MAG: DUF167 domain-containing protein [Ktedonobacteraceae bacterium]|nr:DUF167 domain-containing protein [Ktedonobacteraceae bacterium]MBV9709675.1 DUF167 domain-containing protein [Ktedonobacteraceae bacterium]